MDHGDGRAVENSVFLIADLTLDIDDLEAGGPDMSVTLTPLNQTSISGVIGGTSGEVINFSPGANDGNDVGDLSVTVVCQSGASPVVDTSP